VLDARNAFVTDSMLRDVTRYGTGAAATKALGRGDIAGKTGTTSDAIDGWFAGYGGNVVAVAWMGYDDPRSLGGREFGATLALPIWIDYMQVALGSALLRLQHARVHEDEIKPRLQNLGNVDRGAYQCFELVERIVDAVEQARRFMGGVTHHVLDHFRQLILVADVAVQAAHRQPGFTAQVTQVHRTEADLVGQLEGGVEDFLQILQRRLAALNRDALGIAVQ
jgi:membrane peptidoglycan carboxypeptidase